MSDNYSIDVIARIVELVKEDQQLHDAVVKAVKAHAEYERARAVWLKAKNKRQHNEKPVMKNCHDY